MPEQQTLPGTPDTGGIWARYRDRDHIDHAAWLRARSEHAPVGTCRRCPEQLLPERPHEHAGRIDYVAVCRDRQCGGTVVAPGGRLFKGDGSTSWSKNNGTARAAAIHRAAKEASS